MNWLGWPIDLTRGNPSPPRWIAIRKITPLGHYCADKKVLKSSKNCVRVTFRCRNEQLEKENAELREAMKEMLQAANELLEVLPFSCVPM